MYSLVMMAAMSGGPSTPAADMTPAPVVVVGGCTGCTGCTGYYAGCTGCTGYYAGCCGTSCHGGHKGMSSNSCCGGGGLFHRSSGCCGGGGGLFRGHKSHGCCGGYSCTGYSCSGYSCTGASCFGSYSGGCWGSCYGTVTYPGVMTVPGGVVMPPPMGTPPVVVPPVTMPPGGTKPPDGTKPGGTGANLKFRLPADAKLFVDGQLTSGQGAERAFFTPSLEAGQKYFYDVKAELVVDGALVTEQKRVIVEAGAELVETFPKLTAAAEKAGGTVASK